MCSYNEGQRDALFSTLFDKVLYMFRTGHCPSSGVSQRYIHAIGICHASSVGFC
jgi:hypothetical protein